MRMSKSSTACTPSISAAAKFGALPKARAARMVILWAASKPPMSMVGSASA